MLNAYTAMVLDMEANSLSLVAALLDRLSAVCLLASVCPNGHRIVAHWMFLSPKMNHHMEPKAFCLVDVCAGMIANE